VRPPDPRRSGLEVRYNEEEAEKAVEFCRRRMRLTKGTHRGAPMVLADWQADDIFRPVYGWQFLDVTTGTWKRLYRQVYIELPKKNGKSPIAAAFAGKSLFADSEGGPEVYSLASGKRQASTVFNYLADSVEMDPVLKDPKRTSLHRGKLYTHNLIYNLRNQGIYMVLPADADTTDGINPSAAIIDELHRQPSRELYDLVTASFGAREQPLLIIITTAGLADPTHIAWEVHQYAAGVLDGTIKDPHFYPYIRGATIEETDGDGWRDEDLWKRVNPALTSFNPAMIHDLRSEAAKAAQSPAKLASFKRLRLNVWLPASSAALNKMIDLVLWDRSAGIVLLERLSGRKCYGGLDMASTIDMASLVVGFPNDPADCRNARCHSRPDDPERCFDIIARFWVPADNLTDESKRWPRWLKDLMRTWVREGWVTATAGAIIDDRDIEAEIDGLRRRYQLEELAKDPFQSKQLGVLLEDAGLVVWDLKQSIDQLADPTDQLIRLATAGRLHHGGNPVLRWMIDNAVLIQSADGKHKPDRKKSAGKIDGVFALLDMLAAAYREEEEDDEVFLTIDPQAGA
jgi:phage terminase large subunit-like protein